MNRDELKEFLPHREPMLLLDECVPTETGCRGIYRIRGDEWFLQGHFPGNPIVPGVIQCEMAAQSCSMLFLEDLKGKQPLFTGIKEAKFRRQVRTGDELRFECEIIRIKKPFYFAKSSAYVGEELCMSGEFSFVLADRG